MTNASKTRKKVNEFQAKLVVTGMLLTFGWTLVLAATNWLSTLSCVISPSACAEGAGLARFILFTPIFAGAILTPVGLLYNQKLSRLIKLFIVLAMAFILYYAAYYLVVFAGIFFYGLRG